MFATPKSDYAQDKTKIESQTEDYLKRYRAGEISDEQLGKDIDKSLERLDKSIEKAGLSKDQFIDICAIETNRSIEDVETAFKNLHEAASTLKSGKIFLPKGSFTKELIAQSVYGYDGIGRDLNYAFGYKADDRNSDLQSQFITKKNSCGAQACYGLISAQEAAMIPTEEQKAKEFSKQLIEDCNSSMVGTMPGNITKAINNAVPDGFTAHHQSFNSSTETVSFIEGNTPALVKLGTSLLRQHYTTITHFEEVRGRSYAVTSDDLIIPKEKLAELLEVKPYANSVWTIERDTKAGNLQALKLPPPSKQ